MILALEVFTMKSECKTCTCEIIRNHERQDRVNHELCNTDHTES